MASGEEADQSDQQVQAKIASLAVIGDVVFVYDEQGRFVYGNQALLELWGAELDDLVGRHLRELVQNEELATTLEQQVSHVIRTGETVKATTRYDSPSGDTRYFEYVFSGCTHDDGTWAVGSAHDVSDRVQLTNILESISDAFYALDSEFRFTYVNRRASEVLERDRDELIGRKVWEEFPEAAEIELYEMYHKSLEDLQPRSVEIYYEPLETWFDIHVHPTPGLLSVYFQDITEEARIRRELAANERRYRTLTNAMPQMVWLTDRNGFHIYYNDRWYEFTGLSEDESLGYGFANALHPQDRERTLQEWQKAWRGGVSYEIEYRFYSRPNAEYRWFLGRAFPVFDDAGQITEWVGTCTDIEPQKRAEARLVESERRLAEAQRIARVGNWEFDIRTGEFSCSPEHMRLFGFDQSDDPAAMGLLVSTIHPDDRQQVRAQRDRVLEQGFGDYDIEYRITRPDGEQRVLHTLAEVVVDESGAPTRLVGTVHDVTERKEIEHALEDYARQQAVLSRQLQQLNSTLEQQVEERTAELRRLSQNLEQMVWDRTAELEESRAELAHQAQHDSLTQIPNRILFEERLDHAIATAERNDKLVAILFIDLDGFKLINDTFGHAAGDSVLKTVADRLQGRLRRNDTLARHGGDEFVAILEGLHDPDDARAIGQELLAALNEPFTFSQQSVRLSASMGVSIYPQDAQTVQGLQRQADVAMYRAKLSGKNDIRFYSPSMNAAVEERLVIASHLSTALENGEMQVHFQPQWGAFSGRIEAFEALLRWFNPVLGSVSPTRLIPIAEEVGLMTEIGNWVLDESCRQAAIWTEQTGERIGIAVNISPVQINRDEFVDAVSSVLDRHRLVPSQLELELTENSVVTDLERAIERMGRLREIGVRIAMDDFGLGSSSLSNLVRLPLDTVKIDRAFIRDLHDNSAADRVVHAIVALTDGIGLDVVAEGIETEAQRERVIALRCERLQGFLLGYPADAESTLKMLKRAFTSTR